MSKAPAAPKVDVDDLVVSDPFDGVKVEDMVDTETEAQPFDESDDLSKLLSQPLFSQAIQKIVDQQVNGRLGGSSPNTFVSPGQQNAPTVTPDVSFLKHYRNDSSPEIQIVELDMDSDVPHLNPLPGAPTIRFRRGHFFATTENQVKQIEWMIAGARGVDGAKDKFGGSVGIYEDHGETLYFCPYGCPADVFVSASKDALNAHMRATHGVDQA